MSHDEQITESVLKLDVELMKERNISVESLWSRARKCHEKATDAYVELVIQSVKCGWYLLQLKNRVGHGRFIQSAEENLKVHRTMIHNYMTIAKRWEWLPLPRRDEIARKAKSFRALLAAVKVDPAQPERTVVKKLGRRRVQDECESKGCVTRNAITIQHCDRHMVDGVVDWLEGADIEDVKKVSIAAARLIDEHESD